MRGQLVSLWARAARGEGEHGQGLVEYAFILVMIALVVITALITLGHQVHSLYSNIQCAFPNSGCP
jgi:Flp pilus assembly pilin Flp